MRLIGKFVTVGFGIFFLYSILVTVTSFYLLRSIKAWNVAETLVWGGRWTKTTGPLTLVPEFGRFWKFTSFGLEALRAVDTDDVLASDWTAVINSLESAVTYLPDKNSVLGSRLPEQVYDLVESYGEYLPVAAEVAADAPQLVGYNSPQHYVVLFQNNMELRPTGGFLGSYAEVVLDKGKISDLKIQDIYVPDGQIKGYVPEPAPIKKYLFNDNHPGWRLRDANWHPDFTESAKALEWFFTEGGLTPIDGFIAINLHPIVDILGSVPVYIPDYDLTVTNTNFYHEAQRQAEENFFPGSTQKGDFLRSVGAGLLHELERRPEEIPRIIPAILANLAEKHISVYIPALKSDQWHANGWDGSLRTFEDDFLSINEANVGITKANCCIDRSLTDEITVDGESATHNLKIKYKNNNPTKPIPPAQWGGGYKNYLRIITPASAKLSNVTVNGRKLPRSAIDVEVFGDLQMSFGFLVLTEGGQESEVEVEYQVARAVQAVQAVRGDYSLLFQKQAGVEEWPVTLEIRDKGQGTRDEISKSLRTDEVFVMK